MAIAFRAADKAGNASGGDLTINAPAGVQDNDILIAVCYREAGSWTAPDGWALIRDQAQSTTLWVSLYWKRASSEGASYLFQLNTTTWRSMAIAAFSGALTSGDAIETSNGTNNASGNPTLISISTTTDACMIAGGLGMWLVR